MTVVMTGYLVYELIKTLIQSVDQVLGHGFIPSPAS